MSDAKPELAQRALTLSRLATVAGALDLDIGELVTLAGLFEGDLETLTRVTVDGQFESAAVLSLAPAEDSELAGELRRRESPLAHRLGEEPAAGRRRYLELSALPDHAIEFALWELGGRGEADGEADGEIVGEIFRAGEIETCRAVGGANHPDAREIFPALAETLAIAPAERGLIADVHPLLSRGRSVMYSVSAAKKLTVYYRRIATSDVIRLLVGLRAGLGVCRDIGARFGRFAGAAGASEVDVLELSLESGRPPALRLSVDLVSQAEKGARA